MSIQVILAVIGALAGVAYAGLGIAAGRHLKAPASKVDRVANWSMLWWLERPKYEQRAHRLCSLGGIAFGICTLCWVLYAVGSYLTAR